MAGIFSMGTRAIFASQTMLDTVGHNISNVNTPGYSRQQVELSTENGMFTGAGFFGRGVRVVTVSRQTNEFLSQEVNRNAAAASSDQTRLDKLNQLEKVFPMGESGLGFSASQLLNAFVDVANQPQDMSARQVALARAQEWVSRVNSAGQQINEIQRGVAMDVQTTVERINNLTAQIGEANQAIASYKGVGHEPNDLLDRRDLLVKQLSELTQVTTVKADDNSLSVFMGGGQLLVLGTDVQRLSVVADPNDSSLRRVALLNRITGAERILDPGQVTGGSLHGLLRFQDNDVIATRDRLDAFVSAFADAVNEQQALGLDADGIPASAQIFNNTATASGIRLGLSSPKGIAAASPFVAVAPSENRGTAAIDSLRMLTQSTDYANAPTVTVQFGGAGTTPGTIEYAVSINGSAFDFGTWNPGSPITVSLPDGTSYEVMLAGTPRGQDATYDGDTLSISPTQYPLGNNGNALAMLTLRDRAVVSLDGITQATVTDAYSQMVGSLGVIVQSGRTSAELSRTLSTNAEQLLQAEVGVNLDEEAARLIQFQQSYQAAAKILQVAQKVFDVLLDTAR